MISAEFVSRQLITVELAGNRRLNDELRCNDLMPLESRIGIHLNMEYA